MGDLLIFKQKEKPADGKVTILAGTPTGRLCPHCGAVRVEALAMPHGLNGTACLDCDIFFDGDVDDYYS